MAIHSSLLYLSRTQAEKSTHAMLPTTGMKKTSNDDPQNRMLLVRIQFHLLHQSETVEKIESLSFF